MNQTAEKLVMSGFQYFSQRSLRNSGATLRSMPLCPALGGMKPKPDTTEKMVLSHLDKKEFPIKPKNHKGFAIT
jgi:hypothetical protein